MVGSAIYFVRVFPAVNGCQTPVKHDPLRSETKGFVVHICSVKSPMLNPPRMEGDLPMTCHDAIMASEGLDRDSRAQKLFIMLVVTGILGWGGYFKAMSYSLTFRFWVARKHHETEGFIPQ